MAPGLSGRQTGALPKNKPKYSGSQCNRHHRESCGQSSSIEWEPMSELGNKKQSHNRSTHSETEIDSAPSETGRSTSSTMNSQNEITEDYSQNSSSPKSKAPDHKQVVNKLSQIQSYLQQTADLMNAIKSSDSMSVSNESGDSRRMQKFSRIVSENYGPIMCTNGATNSAEGLEEELSRRSEESMKKLEALQKRKQDLLKLQEKAKKQLQEAQAEQSRLVARASSLNQELSSAKMMDLNVHQLNQRLKAVQQMYDVRNQISDTLNDNRMTGSQDCENLDEEQCQETSDTETDFKLVADKMEELNAMKAQLGEIQKIMASINGVQITESAQGRDSHEDLKDRANHHFQPPKNEIGDEPNSNALKLEHAKSKLNHLTQLLDIVQTAQNTTGLAQPYLQLVTNFVNDEAGSSTPSPSPSASISSPQKNRDEISYETMHVMTKELEETTAAMKEERDKLEATRQELQTMARRLPLNKSRGENLSPNDDSENEPPCLKPVVLDSPYREMLNVNGPAEGEHYSNCNDKRLSTRNLRQHGTWNASLSASNSSIQERPTKNESVSRNSTVSSRGGCRSLIRDSRWSPTPSVTYSNDRANPVVQAQHQLEMAGNICDMILSESGVRPGEISLQGMFNQHQLLTRTVAQCSQLLWLQQKQIIELRNAIMLLHGGLPNFNPQNMFSSQPQANVPPINNSPYMGFPTGTPFTNMNQYVPVPVQQHHNSHAANHNTKLNSRDIHGASVSGQEYPEPHFLSNGNQSSFAIPDLLDYDLRCENFSRLNIPNSGQNMSQTVAGSNSRVPNGINCLGSEDSGALNNQVPPGNRANNYWDNFRSYSRQNLLSNSKSNEDTESSRRTTFSSTSHSDRTPRDLPPPLQNNQAVASTSQHMASSMPESISSEQFLLPPSQNIPMNHHCQVVRKRPVEGLPHRNSSAKNETRHQDNDSRMLSSGVKNEGTTGTRARNSDGVTDNIRSVRNDVNQSLRNTDNLNSRNYSQPSRCGDHENEDVPHGINKKRLERFRCRKEGVANLNNRGNHNTSLWDNISLEVSNFIRTNEARPHFLVQLFRDLQQVTTDNLRQRTLESIQETVSANNLTERPSNTNGGNVNLIENRNNIRENRSNLNRNQIDDPNRIDELFCHLRENQNTIRQNIGMSSFNGFMGGNNLENPNISNIRDLVNSRNNIQNEGLRDLRTYFEANLCNFGGHHSTLENPNLSNIRENLTRREPGVSDHENVNPKNVYLSIYDNASVELRRRNQEPPVVDVESFSNYEVGGGYSANEYLLAGDSVRTTDNNNQFELESLEGAVGGRGHFMPENSTINSRFPPMFDDGDNFGNSRHFIPNINDSGIDINFNNDERKRSFREGEPHSEGGLKHKKAETTNDRSDSSSHVVPQWQRTSGRENSFESSSFLSLRDNSFLNCRSFQQLDNGDLAEADQSRNDEASIAESDSGFMLPQVAEPEAGFGTSQSHRSSESNFSNQNVPESERNFQDPRKCTEGDEIEGAAAVEENATFPNSTSEPEGNFLRVGEPESMLKGDPCEGCYYQLNGGAEGGNSVLKYRARGDESERDTTEMKKGAGKNALNKTQDNVYKKYNGSTDYEVQNGPILSFSSPVVSDERQRTESRESVFSVVSEESFPFVLVPDKNAGGDKGNTSPEAESDWECGSGLDQVPTRLKKGGEKRQSRDFAEEK
ncbi:hypothetical protein RUM43_014279 [Polyplax serrata]|uniref:Pericentriolar material 1 protein C-terminal domain-containing protein n=1 Tax=Polyplax serrata TaxID=468196 RepID=A0AAN8PH35_POLSC